MPILRKNKAYQIAADRNQLKLVCFREDQTTKSLSALKKRIDDAQISDVKERRTLYDIAVSLLRCAKESCHFTKCVNELYGPKNCYCVCFYDEKKLAKTKLHDYAHWILDVGAFVIGLPSTGQDWIIACDENQKRFKTSLSKPGHKYITLVKKLTMKEGQSAVYPPVPRRYVFHHWILHEVAHTKLGPVCSIDLDSGKIPFDQEKEMKADKWALNHLTEFLVAERRLIQRL